MCSAAGRGIHDNRNRFSANAPYVAPPFNGYSPEKAYNMTTAHRGQGFTKSIQIKPSLLEKDVVNKEEFMKLSDGFKRIFTDDKQVRNTSDL